ncbi:MAG: thermonuclease family protein [Patescibacteria group bacterium]
MAKFSKFDLLKTWGIKVILAVSVLINGLVGWNYYSGNTVSRVIDGDTFDLKNGTRVRLLDVESPEIGLCGSEEAKRRLEELVLGKFVTVKELTFEEFNRQNGLVYQGSKLINEVMIRDGWGRLHYNPNSKREDLKAAYKEARENQRGIFGMDCIDAEPVDPNCRIKGNIDEDKQKKSYHLSNCRDYNRVTIDRDRGEDYYCSEKEAQAAGFTKASGCE